MADGYIKLYGKLKSVTEEGKVADYSEIDGVPIIMQDLNASGFSPVVNTYYKHTGTTQAQFTQGVIYFYNGTNYIALENDEFVPKKTTTGTYVYTHNGETQGEMEVKSSITPSDNEIPTSNGVISLIADKQDKLDVEVPARVNADINLTLENNKEFRYEVLYGAINISFPSNPALDFMCELDIQSMPSMSYPNNIKWSGDDIENGVFVPDSQALTPYQILFYTSGVSNNIWNGIVRKPSV